MPEPDTQPEQSCPFVGGIWPQVFYGILNEAIDGLRTRIRQETDAAVSSVYQNHLDELMTQRQRFRDQSAAFVGMLLRIASEDYPGLVAYAADKPTIARIVSLEKDMDEMATALAQLQRGKK